MIIESCFMVVVLSSAWVMADKEYAEKLIQEREKLFGPTLRNFPLYRSLGHPFVDPFSANKLDILNGANNLPLNIKGLGNTRDRFGRLISLPYRRPVESFNFPNFVGQIVPANEFAFPQLFNTGEDTTGNFLHQTPRQLAARALHTSPSKFSIDDLINLLLIQLLTKQENNNRERMLTDYPVSLPLSPNLNQRSQLYNPFLHLPSYLPELNDPRNTIPSLIQKRGRALNEKSGNPDEISQNSKSHFESLKNPSSPLNIDDIRQQSIQKETLVPMFKLARSNVGTISNKGLDRRVP